MLILSSAVAQARSTHVLNTYTSQHFLYESHTALPNSGGLFKFCHLFILQPLPTLELEPFVSGAAPFRLQQGGGWR